MNRIYSKCPQCSSKECGDITCRFTGKDHKDAAAQLTPDRPNAPEGWAKAQDCAVATDIGYECAWPNA